MELFKLEPGLAIWTWIAFAVLFFILWKFFFPVLLKNIRDREKKISQSIDDAEEIEKRLDQINSEYDETMKKARSEGDQLLLKTRQEAEVLRQELLKKSDEESKNIISHAREKSVEERKIMLRSFEKEIAEFVCETSEKVVNLSFTAENDRKFVRELLKKL